MLNKYILTSMGIFLLCFMVSCSNSNNSMENVGDSISSTIDTSSETFNTTVITTTATTTTITTTIEDTTQTSLAPSDYKSIIQNTITDYESMLMRLNTIIQNFSYDTSWNEQLQECLDTSQNYLDTLNSLQSTGAVPKKYSNSHQRITYCINHYTESIKLIQQAIDCYSQNDELNGDDYMNQALNRSELANKVWSQIRGYGIVEYTGETLEPQVVYSEPEQIIISDELETIILQTTAETTQEVTYSKYNDGYAFGDDNVFIYTN